MTILKNSWRPITRWAVALSFYCWPMLDPCAAQTNSSLEIYRCDATEVVVGIAPLLGVPNANLEAYAEAWDEEPDSDWKATPAAANGTLAHTTVHALAIDDDTIASTTLQATAKCNVSSTTGGWTYGPLVEAVVSGNGAAEPVGEIYDDATTHASHAAEADSRWLASGSPNSSGPGFLATLHGQIYMNLFINGTGSVNPRYNGIGRNIYDSLSGPACLLSEVIVGNTTVQFAKLHDGSGQVIVRSPTGISNTTESDLLMGLDFDFKPFESKLVPPNFFVWEIVKEVVVANPVTDPCVPAGTNAYGVLTYLGNQQVAFDSAGNVIVNRIPLRATNGLKFSTYDQVGTTDISGVPHYPEVIGHNLALGFFKIKDSISGI